MGATQSAISVAYRAFCLGALLKRSELEIGVRNLKKLTIFPDVYRQLMQRLAQANQRLHRWIDDEQLAHYLTLGEAAWLDSPLGSWSYETILDMTWRVESVGVLLWALNIIDELPPFDTQFDPLDALAPLDLITPTIDFIWRADLRPTRDLYAMRDYAELWHWRSQARELQLMGIQPDNGQSFSEIIRITAEKARDKGIPPLIDGDFPAFGRSYARQTVDQFCQTSAIAAERYATLNWLCDAAMLWEGFVLEHV